MNKEFGKYRTYKCVNIGYNTKLYSAKNSLNGDPVILQVYHSKNKTFNKVPDIHMLQQLQHPNILKTLEFFEIEKEQKKYSIIVLEYILYKELFDFISITGNFDEETCRYYFRQMISALSFIHSKGIAHRDIKPECLLIDEQFNLKIFQFDFAKYSQNGKFKTKVLKVCYMPPELFSNNEYNGFAYDMFSAGVVLFIMYFGSPPFLKSLPTDPHYKLFCNNNTKYWNMFQNKSNKNIPEDFKILINGLFEKNPEHRFTVDQVLQQQWMVGKVAQINLDEFGQRTLQLPQNEIQIINNHQERQYYGQYVRIHKLQPDLELAIDSINNSYVKIHILQNPQDIQQQEYYNKMEKQQHKHKCQFFKSDNLFDSTKQAYIFGMISEYCCGLSLSNYIQNTSPFNSRVCRYVFGQLYELIFDLNSKDVFQLNINQNSIIIKQNFQIKVDNLLYQDTQNIFAKQDIYQHDQLQKNDIYQAGLVLFYMYFGQLPFNQISDNDQQYMFFRDNRKQFWEYNISTLKNKQEILLQDLIQLIEGMIEPNINLRFNLKDIQSNNWFQQQIVEINYIHEVFLKLNQKLMQIQEMKTLEQMIEQHRNCKRVNQSRYFSYKQDRIYNFANIEYLLDQTRMIMPQDKMHIQFYTPFLIDFLIRYLLQYFKQMQMDILNIDTRYTITIKFNGCTFEQLFWQTPIYNTGISFNLLEGDQQIFNSIIENIIKQITIA